MYIHHIDHMDHPQQQYILQHLPLWNVVQDLQKCGWQIQPRKHVLDRAKHELDHMDRTESSLKYLCPETGIDHLICPTCEMFVLYCLFVCTCVP